MKNCKKKKRSNAQTDRPDEVFLLRHSLRWRLTLFVFCITLLSGILTVGIALLLVMLAPSAPFIAPLIFNPMSFCVLLLIVCAIFGTVLAGVFGKYYLRPLKRLSAATKEVKRGNYKVQVEQLTPPVSEMGILIDNFNEMVRELDGIELFRNDFINNFSHEFKTPIVSIRGFAKELERNDLDFERRREYAHIIAEEADRLSKLAINVLELSRLENQQIVTDKTYFFLDEQLRQSILLLESEWAAKNIEIIPELEEVRYFGNEEILSHIWNNLVSNAVKFTPDGGTVTVRLSVEDSSVQVAISDTGIGMSEEVLLHIFEKFYQGDPSHHKKGHGIGLTMAQRAAILSGGSISVQSIPGEGSTFLVTLPRGN